MLISSLIDNNELNGGSLSLFVKCDLPFLVQMMRTPIMVPFLFFLHAPIYIQVLYDFIDQRDISLGVYRGSHHAWVPATLMYGTRAKPERRDGTSLKKRNLQPGVYACLNGDIELPSYPAGLSKWEGQRRCYGKVSVRCERSNCALLNRIERTLVHNIS